MKIQVKMLNEIINEEGQFPYRYENFDNTIACQEFAE